MAEGFENLNKIRIRCSVATCVLFSLTRFYQQATTKIAARYFILFITQLLDFFYFAICCTFAAAAQEKVNLTDRIFKSFSQQHKRLIFSCFFFKYFFKRQRIEIKNLLSFFILKDFISKKLLLQNCCIR
jgi:hypothetical protein